MSTLLQRICLLLLSSLFDSNVATFFLCNFSSWIIHQSIKTDILLLKEMSVTSSPLYTHICFDIKYGMFIFLIFKFFFLFSLFETWYRENYFVSILRKYRAETEFFNFMISRSLTWTIRVIFRRGVYSFMLSTFSLSRKRDYDACSV